MVCRGRSQTYHLAALWGGCTRIAVCHRTSGMNCTRDVVRGHPRVVQRAGQIDPLHRLGPVRDLVRDRQRRLRLGRARCCRTSPRQMALGRRLTRLLCRTAPKERGISFPFMTSIRRATKAGSISTTNPRLTGNWSQSVSKEWLWPTIRWSRLKMSPQPGSEFWT